MDEEDHKFEQNDDAVEFFDIEQYPSRDSETLTELVSQARLLVMPDSQDMDILPHSPDLVNSNLAVDPAHDPNSDLHYDLVRAEVKKDNWALIIKILSWIVLVSGIIDLVYNIIGFIYYLALENGDPCYSGGLIAFMCIFDIILSTLAIIQGCYGIETVRKDKPEAISKLIKISIRLTFAHLAIIGIKMICVFILGSYFRQKERYYIRDNSINRQSLPSSFYGLMFLGLIYSCFDICC